MKCEFNTSSGEYIETGTISGWSKEVAIVMPTVQASAYIEPTSLFVSETNKTFIYTIINEGDGSNNIAEAKIYVPGPIFSIPGPNVQSAHIINDAAWAQHSGGVITLRYDQDPAGSLVTGQTDTITIDVSVSASRITNNIPWLSRITNMQGPSYPYTTVTTGKYQNVDVVELLSAIAGITPNNIYSTSITNDFTFTVTNTSTSINTNEIYYLKLFMPSIITNVHNIQSSVLSTNNITVDWNSNHILLDYAANGTNIGKNLRDIITFTVIDSIDAGYTNMEWLSQVRFSNSGYINTWAVAGYSRNVSLTMPVPDASAYILPAEIYTTAKSNSFAYVITNKGLGTDRILRARISIPTGFTQINNIQSSIISNDTAYAYTSNNYIILDYNSDGRYISPQTCETVTFMAYDNITSENSYVWLSEVYNYAANWEATGIYPSKTRTVNSKMPSYSAK